MFNKKVEQSEVSKKVCGYVRVSTEEQSEQGWSIDSQKEKIRSYCAVYNFDLVKIYEDDGISAKDIIHRPAMNEMLSATTGRGKSVYSGIVCVKLDQIFRNMIETLEIAESWRKKGIEFHSINESLDTSSAVGMFFFQMLAALAQMERHQISERTKDGMNERRRQGYALSSIAPYGWDTVEIIESGKDEPVLRLIQNDKEMGILNTVYKLCVRGLWITDIATELNRIGCKRRNGKDWEPQYIYSIFKSIHYYGIPNVELGNTELLFRLTKDSKRRRIAKVSA